MKVASDRASVSRRGRGSVTALLVIAGLLLACTPAAAPPAAAPTTAPAAAPTSAAPQAAQSKPTSAPGAAVQATAQAAAAQATAPAAAAKPPAGPAGDQARGVLNFVATAEPDTIVPKHATAVVAMYVMDNVYERLTRRDYSSGQPRIVGQLAESWSQVDPLTWRFKLRQDVKFTNGEPFNADAVVTAVTDLVDPAVPARALNEYGTVNSARKVDEYTVDIMTRQPDPILPVRLVRFSIAAPKWLTTSPTETLSTTAVGSGPYLLSEWVKGSHLVLKANPGYNGAMKPSIAEVRIIGRKEAGVRANMVQAGEAELAYLISPDAIGRVPQLIVEPSMESVIVRINPQHPVLQDVRVRQAIAYAVNAQAMADALFPGYSSQLNGQFVRQGSVGWNPELKPYPYNPAESRRLLQEAGAVGTPLEYICRADRFPKADEVCELVVGALNEVGFKATIRNVDVQNHADALRAVKPGQKFTDLLMTSVSNPILDASRVFDNYFACGGQFAQFCDQEWNQRYATAQALGGEERDKAFQGLWAYAYDKFWYLPLFGMDYLHGASPKVKWTPHNDGLTFFSDMRLED
jgi:peptide/nickel transport system substrate-binding protein